MTTLKDFSPRVQELVKQALEVVGPIKPWFDAECGEWTFEHPAFPESYGGATAKEVIKGYPLYLANMFEAQLQNRLTVKDSRQVKKSLSGRGGSRPGSGRPRTEPKTRKWVPVAMAELIDRYGGVQVAYSCLKKHLPSEAKKLGKN